MKPVHAMKNISDKNYHALKQYLDLLIPTFDEGILPTVQTVE
jgi:hypothetical protein